MRATIVSSILFALGTSVLVATACAPQQDETAGKGRVLPRTGVAKILEDCASQIRATHTQKITHSIKTCEIPNEIASEVAPAQTQPKSSAHKHKEQWPGVIETSLPAEESIFAVAQSKPKTKRLEPGSVKGYSLITKDTSYGVSTNSGKIVVTLDVLVDYPEEMAANMISMTEFVLQSQCESNIANVWRRSGIELKMKFTNGESFEESDDRPRLTFLSTAESKDPKHPLLRVANWPDRGEMFPRGLAEDWVECKKTPGNEKRCVNERREAANQRFCVSLALKVGEWLGLESPDVKTCGQPQPKAAAGGVETAALLAASTDHSAQAAATPVTGDATKAAAPSFMKTADDPEAKGKAFWEKASVSGSDLKVVLGSVCKDFENAKEDVLSGQLSKDLERP